MLTHFRQTCLCEFSVVKERTLEGVVWGMFVNAHSDKLRLTYAAGQTVAV